MTWLRMSSVFLALSLMFASVLSAVCPKSCVCTTTRDGLHRATCSNLTELYKFTLQQKHHNINVLDLSHNNITQLSHELDRLTEVVTIDLSTNGITKLNKFLYKAKKLVHLNLANNRISALSLTYLPKSISSLDLTNNLLQDVPSDIEHLGGLEHLELKGNPINCSCKNIKSRNSLLDANVYIDNVTCASPVKLVGHSWLNIKTKDVCKGTIMLLSDMDLMMGDQPIDADTIGKDAKDLESMSLVASGDLSEGNIVHEVKPAEDDDKDVFLKVGHYNSASSSSVDDIEGSGEFESTTMPDITVFEPRFSKNVLKTEEMLPPDNEPTTEDPIEGSGEGSGFMGLEKVEEPIIESTQKYEELNPGRVHKLFEDDSSSSTTEFPLPKSPNVYEGGPDWHSRSESPQESLPESSEKPSTPTMPRDTTVSEQIRVTQASEIIDSSNGEKPTTHKTGTYVCIAIIVILLVGLIGFAIIKGQVRKRRDRRLLRQQKRDVEKASKEMVDMNKSLLGKPASIENPVEKKINGKYELVPTHDAHQKKSENGDVGNGIKHGDQNGVRTDSPRDTNQNKKSSRDNNLPDSEVSPQDTSLESTSEVPDSKKDASSLSSEDIFVPINDDDVPKLNGNDDSEISHPLINGEDNTDSDFLSPSREYVPVYSPDMGKVRIKLTETPKPKTPVLVTRSRSNAGDIIITPAMDGNVRKSTT